MNFSSFPKPYRRAVLVEFAVQAHSNIACVYAATALKMATNIDVLIVMDASYTSRDPRALIDAHLAELHLLDRVRVQVLRTGYEAEQYFETCTDLELVIADRIYFHRLDDWNCLRKKRGIQGYDILCGWTGGSRDWRDDGQLPARAFRMASIGGTFNSLHHGHKRYVIAALQLADDVHVFIADDDYARARKHYKPNSLAKRMNAFRDFTRKLKTGDRVITQVLRRVADIEAYVRTARGLDVIVTERDYFDWFDEWNELRRGDGQAYYNILCKERTIVLGTDLTSSMLAEIEAVECDTDFIQRPLF